MNPKSKSPASRLQLLVIVAIVMTLLPGDSFGAIAVGSAGAIVRTNCPARKDSSRSVGLASRAHRVVSRSNARANTCSIDISA